MKIFTIRTAPYENEIKYMREACRAIIMRGDEILVSREERTDLWLLPGGGLEDNESAEECCAREVLEETGYTVRVGEFIATAVEFFDEEMDINKYFVCEITGNGDKKLTPQEVEIDQHPVRINVYELLDIFEKRKKDGSGHPRLDLREATAIREYLKEREKNAL